MMRTGGKITHLVSSKATVSAELCDKYDKSSTPSHLYQATSAQVVFRSVTKTEPTADHGKGPNEIPGNTGMIGDKTRWASKASLGFGYDDISQSDCSSKCSSDASDENADKLATSALRRGSFSQMLADVSASGNTPFPLPTADLNSEVGLWNALSGRTEPRPALISGASQVPSVTMVGSEGILLHDHQFTQSQEAERQLKQLKRKQSNRESAKRSKLRKQVECEKLQTKVDKMREENNALRDELNMLAKQSEMLTSEYNSIREELTQDCKYNGLSNIQINNFVSQFAHGEENFESSRIRDLFKSNGKFAD